MRASALLWTLGVSTAALIAACGSDVGVQQSAGSAGAGGQGAMSSGSGTSAAGMGGHASTSASTSAGPGGMDASPDGMFVPGLFDCQGCLCDGKTHYCYIVHGGAMPGPPPEPPCEDDAGATTGCIPLPPQCAAMPVCSCVYPMMGACLCEEMGGGVTVTCNLP